MTKKLVWRLGKLPEPIDLADLVKNKIITAEEAKTILFKTEDDQERNDDSLKSEIKFLRELVDKLSNNSTTKLVETIRYIEKPYYSQLWYQPYMYWCSNVGTSHALGTSSTQLLSVTTGTTGIGAVANGASNLNLNASNQVSNQISVSSFKNIATF